jgi:hypothetical protein
MSQPISVYFPGICLRNDQKQTLRHSVGKMNAQISYKFYFSLNLPAVVSPAKSKEEYLELNKYICPDH